MHFQRTLIALTVLVLFATACSRDPAPGTPAAAAEGERLMRRMSETLTGVSAFQFETEESLEPVETTQAAEVLRFSRSVTVRRPDSMFFHVRGSGATPVDVTAYYDGRTVSLRGDAGRVWAQTEVPETLDEMLDDVARRFSLPVPIADVVYSVPHEAFIGRDTTGGFVGRETIDGVGCATLVYDDALVGVHLWIPSSGQSLPRRLELVYKHVPGAPRARIDFKNWNLEPEIDPGMFRFEPEEGAVRIAFEEFVGALLSGGKPGMPETPSTPDSGDGGQGRDDQGQNQESAR